MFKISKKETRIAEIYVILVSSLLTLNTFSATFNTLTLLACTCSKSKTEIPE